MTIEASSIIIIFIIVQSEHIGGQENEKTGPCQQWMSHVETQPPEWFCSHFIIEAVDLNL